MGKVLVVEDHEVARQALAVALRRTKYDVLLAERGSSAVQAVRRERPELVLLDIMLPGNVDGIEACRQIKADPLTQGCFVIMMSGRNNHQDFVRARQAGANAYLVKPFKLSKLFDIVMRHDSLRDTFTLDLGPV